MHEVAIAQEIISIVDSYLPKGNGITVKSVKVEIGDFSNILPEALEFGFEVLINDTKLQGAKLEIIKIPLKVCCLDCNNISELTEPLFYCYSCNSTNVVIKSGTELKVLEIELND